MYKNILAKIKEFSFFDTFKHASTYFTGTLLVHALGLLSMPVFTAYMSREEYGIINVFTSYISVISVLLSLNLHWAITRYYFEEEKTDFGSFLGTLFVTISLLYWTVGGLCLYNKEVIATYTNMPVISIFWVIVSSYLLIIYSFFEQIMVATKQSKRFTRAQVTWQYIKFACAVGALVYWNSATYTENGIEESYTFMGKIIGDWVGTLIMAFYFFYQIMKYMSFKGMSRSHLKYAFFYSIPLIPFALSDYILISFDQLYINSTIGKAEVGMYSFAYKISMLYLGLGAALLNGAQASYYKFMNEKNYHEVWKQVDSMSKLLVLGAGFLILFAVDIGTLLSSNDAFLEALTIAPIIVAAYIFHGISNFYGRGIYYVKRNSYLAAIILTSGVVNIFLNVYFLEIYGYQAAAYTTLASYIIMFVLSVFVTSKILKLPALPLGRIVKYIVILAGIIGLNYLIGQPNVGMHVGLILFKILLFGLLGLIFFYNKIGLLLGKSSK